MAHEHKVNIEDVATEGGWADPVRRGSGAEKPASLPLPSSAACGTEGWTRRFPSCPPDGPSCSLSVGIAGSPGPRGGGRPALCVRVAGQRWEHPLCASSPRAEHATCLHLVLTSESVNRPTLEMRKLRLRLSCPRSPSSGACVLSSRPHILVATEELRPGRGLPRVAPTSCEVEAR